jgi:ABC-type antimicrobial peptide transport system permease subunit
MVYIVGIIGFILGFIIGQAILLKLLKDIPNDKLLNDSSLRWKYGTLNWMFAGLGSFIVVWAYKIYFI